MATASVLVQHLVQTHDAIQAVMFAMQTKLDSLIDSQPYYKHFEIEGEQHTYHLLVAEAQAIDSHFYSLVAAIKDWDIGGINIEEAISLAHRNQKPPSQTLAVLMSISSVPTPVADCADLVLNLFQSIAVFRSRAAPAAVKRDITERMAFKDVTRHQEVPLISIAKQYNGAFKEIKTLSKWLLDLQVDTTSVRRQLDYKQTMVGLGAVGSAPTADPNIAFLLAL